MRRFSIAFLRAAHRSVGRSPNKAAPPMGLELSARRPRTASPGVSPAPLALNRFVASPWGVPHDCSEFARRSRVLKIQESVLRSTDETAG